MNRHISTQVRLTESEINLSRDRWEEGGNLQKEISVDQKVRPLTMGSELQAPIKIVDEHPWSLGVYRLLRSLLGKTLDVAWKRGSLFPTSHFSVINFY